MVVQRCAHSENSCVVHLKWVHCRVCELYLQKSYYWEKKKRKECFLTILPARLVLSIYVYRLTLHATARWGRNGCYPLTGEEAEVGSIYLPMLGELMRAGAGFA